MALQAVCPPNNIGIKPYFLTKNPCFTNPIYYTKKKLMLHSTATPGAKAGAFFNAWNKTSAPASVEFVVDDTQILQYLPIGEQGGKNGIKTWHCGSGPKGSGNISYVATEMCEPMQAQLIPINFYDQGQSVKYPRTYSMQRIQMELKYLGFYTGDVVGSAGPLTTAAIKAYQASVGLPQTGIVNRTTLQKMQQRAGSYAAYDVAGATPFFNACYDNVVKLFAFLCQYLGCNPAEIICHQDGYKMGIAGNHADIYHYFPYHNKTMDTFRTDVANCVKGTYNCASPTTNSGAYTPAVTVTSTYKKWSQADSEAHVHQYLRTTAGLTAIGASGIMGCWDRESSNRADCLEGYYLKSYPGFENVMKDSASLDNYTLNILFPAYAASKIDVNKAGYKGTDGHYYPGFGLAQWTGPRGEKLLQFAKGKNMDWRDLDTQLLYFYIEMQSRKLVDKLNAAKTPEEAALIVLDYYEMYPGFGVKSPAHLNPRQQSARRLYDKYKDKTYAPPAPPPVCTDEMKQNVLNAIDVLVNAGFMDSPDQWRKIVETDDFPMNNVTWLIRKAGAWLCKKSYRYAVATAKSVIPTLDPTYWANAEAYDKNYVIALVSGMSAYEGFDKVAAEKGVRDDSGYLVWHDGNEPCMDKIRALLRVFGEYVCMNNHAAAVDTIKDPMGMNSVDYWKGDKYSALNVRYLLIAVAKMLQSAGY